MPKRETKFLSFYYCIRFIYRNVNFSLSATIAIAYPMLFLMSGCKMRKAIMICAYI